MEEISNYMRRKNKKAELKHAKYAAATLYASIFTLVFLVVTAPAIVSAAKGLDIHFTSVDTFVDNTEWQYPNETVEQMIVRLAGEYGVDADYALKISTCESSNNPLAVNQQGSSASGIWQFTSGTFLDGIRWRGLDWSLEDRFNAEKSTDMAMWFVQREGWKRWACDKLVK